MLEEQKGSPVQQSHVFSAFSFSSSLYLGFLLLTFFSTSPKTVAPEDMTIDSGMVGTQR